MGSETTKEDPESELISEKEGTTAPETKAEDPRIRQLEEQIHQYELQVGKILADDAEGEIRKTQCTCEEGDIKKIQRTPNYKAAARFYNKAKRSSEEKLKEDARKERNVCDCIHKMLRAQIGLPGDVQKDQHAHFLSEILPEIAAELTEELMKIKDIKILDIINVFKKKQHDLEQHDFPYFNAKKITEENGDFFDELISILHAKKPIKIYLEKLIHDVDDIRLLDLPSIWRERSPAYSKEESTREHKSITESARQANEWTDVFFKDAGGLHPDIKAKNYLNDLTDEECEQREIDSDSPQRKGLCNVVAHTVPSDENRLKMLVSAMAKINMMHLAETIKSQVDLDQMHVIREHIKKILDLYIRKTFDGKTILNAGDENEEDAVVCESVDVPEEKSLEAIARKFMDKDAENTRDFDVNAIHDMIRFAVMLTKEDSESPEKMEKATKKTLGILYAIFGTDISQGRLRYTFDSGVTNGNSTGKHQAFHFTFRYRYQCKSNGKNKWETDKVRTVSVEVQIRKYMNSEEKLKDHLDYKQKKDRKITHVAGMNVTFTEFITDICDALLNDYEFLDENKVSKETIEYPVDEKLARILFRVLTRCDNEGVLLNGRTISELQQDNHQWQKIKDVIEKYKTYEAKHINNLRIKMDERKARGKAPRKYEGWRKRAQQSIGESSAHGGIAPSSINKMALQAENVILNFEKFAKKESTIPPVSLPDLDAEESDDE